MSESHSKNHVVPSEKRHEWIQVITNDKGQKTALVIDFNMHEALWEDFYDGLVVKSR